MPGPIGTILQKPTKDIEERAVQHDGGRTGRQPKELIERMGRSSPRSAFIYLHATREWDQQIAAGMGRLFADAERTRTKKTGTAWSARCERATAWELGPIVDA